jgi:hypothetical protein
MYSYSQPKRKDTAIVFDFTPFQAHQNKLCTNCGFASFLIMINYQKRGPVFWTPNIYCLPTEFAMNTQAQTSFLGNRKAVICPPKCGCFGAGAEKKRNLVDITR